jgi:hypothetical protein
MANEAVIIELGPDNGAAYRFTVAEGATIEKGCLCKLSDPRTAAASSGADVFAGIAAAEKVASDGATTLAFHTEGVFDLMSAGAAITAGGLVSLSGANLIKQATEAEMVTGAAFGKALETAAAAGEVIAVKLVLC